MDDRFIKQLKQVIGEVIDQKVSKIVEEKLELKFEEKLAPIYAWQKQADKLFEVIFKRFDHLPKEIMLVFGEGFDAVASHRFHDLEEQADDHEKRIKKLEKTSFIAS